MRLILAMRVALELSALLRRFFVKVEMPRVVCQREYTSSVHCTVLVEAHAVLAVEIFPILPLFLQAYEIKLVLMLETFPETMLGLLLMSVGNKLHVATLQEPDVLDQVVVVAQQQSLLQQPFIFG